MLSHLVETLHIKRNFRNKQVSSQNLMSLTQKTKKWCNYICPPEGLENTPSIKFQDL